MKMSIQHKDLPVVMPQKRKQTILYTSQQIPSSFCIKYMWLIGAQNKGENCNQTSISGCLNLEKSWPMWPRYRECAWHRSPSMAHLKRSLIPRSSDYRRSNCFHHRRVVSSMLDCLTENIQTCNFFVKANRKKAMLHPCKFQPL
jgi:hypothetical protein